MENTKYDAELKQIRHFIYHPELLPYIGENYDKYKVLLIGESHYLEEKFEAVAEYFLDWYDKPTSCFSILDNIINNDVKHNWEDFYKFWFDTRCQMGKNGFENHKMGKTIGKAIFEAVSQNSNFFVKDEADALSYIAYFNYFQRPELGGVKTFSSIFIEGNHGYHGYNTFWEFERAKAYEIATKIFKILEPNKIIFLSRKALNFYNEQADKNSKIELVYHPSSRWWHRKMPNSNEKSKEKFSRLINEYFS